LTGAAIFLPWSTSVATSASPRYPFSYRQSSQRWALSPPSKLTRLSAPPYILCFISIFTCAFVSDRVGVRGPFVAGASLVAAIGYILLAAQKTVAARYFDISLATIIFT
jgi:hypothetical protein